jgi:hypothetical protein
VFELSYLCAIVADFRTSVQDLLSKPRYSVSMSSQPGEHGRGGNGHAPEGLRLL